MTVSMKILYFLFIRATVSFLPRALRNDFSTTFHTIQRENYRQTLNMVQHQPLDGDSVLESLHQYRKMYSNLNVPFSFVVPNDTNWPAHLHGFRLGTVLRRIKYNAALPEYHPQLEKIGFQISTVDYKFEIFIKALKTYKELNNGCTQVSTNDFQFSQQYCDATDQFCLSMQLCTFNILHPCHIVCRFQTISLFLRAIYGPKIVGVASWAEKLAALVLGKYTQALSASVG